MKIKLKKKTCEVCELRKGTEILIDPRWGIDEDDWNGDTVTYPLPDGSEWVRIEYGLFYADSNGYRLFGGNRIRVCPCCGRDLESFLLEFLPHTKPDLVGDYPSPHTEHLFV